jgi:hypothetical protein
MWILVAAMGLGQADGEPLRLDARALFEQSTVRDVALTSDGSALELASGVLVEDDGPAAGYSYKPNEETLSADARLRKTLLVADPRARSATLLVGSGGSLHVTLNGKSVPLEPAGKPGNSWQAWRFDPGALRAGPNEIDLHGTGKIWIARADEFPPGAAPPGRSRRSRDGGKSWADPSIPGEYYVRLFLDQHRPRGTVTLPVLDAANLRGALLGPPVAALRAVRFAVESEGRVSIRARSGPVPKPDGTWSDWRDAAGAVEAPSGRYVQLALGLSTDDPRRTPRVRAVRLQAELDRPEDWTAAVRVVEARTGARVRTSIPFEYESYLHPKLQTLRREYRLDEVVQGARGEFELITRLAAWASRQWEGGHLREAYPPWDALEILKPHADGKPVGGFCQQYNLVFLQACQSFGIPGRAVSIGPGDHGVRIRGGHEVVEIWSNEHRRWVYVDGNTGWYLADDETGTPLSLLELRERQLRAFRGEPARPARVVELAQTRHAWKGLTDWPPFAELRLIPRSNFLERPAPLPLNQGMRGWFWTGHYAWTDAASPASLLYGHRVARRGDFEWTLNETAVTLEAGTARGELRVHLETVTPGFDTFLASVDGGERRPAKTGFVWTLRPGRNTLETLSRNVAGREGIASRIVLEAP